MASVLVVAVGAVLATLWRLLIRVDAETLTAVLTDWLCSRPPVAPPPARRVIPVDGKVLRGAVLTERRVHLLSAYDTSTGVVLAQVQVAGRMNSGARPAAGADQGASGQPDGCGDRRGRPAPAGRPRAHCRRTRRTRTVEALTLQTPGGIGSPHGQQAERVTRTVAGKRTRETVYPHQVDSARWRGCGRARPARRSYAQKTPGLPHMREARGYCWRLHAVQVSRNWRGLPLAGRRRRTSPR
ncbi:hypothetical protein [Micromonospora tarapacensis]|uniref:hypothetical protein n=1 Tax=Micromonospora tarapacensis TaxID=2835305 RepID=UPI001E5FE6EF|nr:hypothetical protein [Micromonospora tarapacensis]